MQKISSYLYPNRILCNVDLAVLPTEWRIVYQRKFKIYKGLDNVLELDIKNADQKRIDVSSKTIKCVIMDEHDQEVYTASIVHSATPGLATFTVPANALQKLTPQFLRYTLYILNNDGTKNPVYGDTQFGVTGTFDLLGSAMPSTPSPKIIDTFNYMDDDSTPAPWTRRWYSEAVEIYQRNWINETPTVYFDFDFKNLDGTVVVQFTHDVVVSTGTHWMDVESFAVTASTTGLTKSYTGDNYSNNLVWARIKYTPTTGTYGTIDKVVVRL
jgi:hypothetical protein